MATAQGKKRIAQHNKLKSLKRNASKKPKPRKPPKKGKTTIKPKMKGLKPVGITIKRTF